MQNLVSPSFPMSKSNIRTPVIVFILILSSILISSPVLANMDEVTPGEIPPNDFRISYMGPDGNTSYNGYSPALAYNSLRDEYLVAWQGHHYNKLLHTDEWEIYGQRIDGSTGALIGDMFRISFMGPEGVEGYQAWSPDVAYNSTRDEFLVVWHGEGRAFPFIIYEQEIWGQRLSYNSSGGLDLTGGKLRISFMGPVGSQGYQAWNPAVAYNHIEDEYLVVWDGDDNTPPLVDGEKEIFGQYMDYSGDVLTGLGSDFRISFMGPDGDPEYDAMYPDVAFNGNRGEYLVVWHGDHDNPFENDEFEIVGRLIYADGSFLDSQLLLSITGGIGDPRYEALYPAVTYNPDDDEWLVVWKSNQHMLLKSEIYGQFLGYSASGSITFPGDDDFRISEIDDGSLLDPFFRAKSPDVAYDPLADKYLVVWYEGGWLGNLIAEELEIFGQMIDAHTKAQVGYNDFRLSDMGPDGNTDYDARTPAVAFSSNNKSFLVVWFGDDNVAPLVNDEFEIFGQRYSIRLPVLLPLVLKDS